MNHKSICIRCRSGALIVATILLCVLGTMSVPAQTFQSTFGGGGGESGRGGVTAVRANGGFIAAGESFSASAPNSDIYVVRVDNTGGLVWSNTYSIGDNDSATCVVECVNGDFVVCGVTDNIGTECPQSRDIFLMRLDSCGHVIWVNTYGDSHSDEIGWEVIEAISGDPAFGTAPGDLIVAGSTMRAGSAVHDACLLRTKAGGPIIWDRTYDILFTDDYFYGLTETVINNVTTNDIVAVGGVVINGNREGLIVRVDGNTGLFNGPLHGRSICSGTGEEEFRSVCEITSQGPSKGNIVAAGYTTTGFSGREALLVETAANVCLLQSQATLGDGGGTGPDEAFCVREDRLGNPGDVIVTGYTTLTGGFGKEDVFLHRFSTGPLTPITPTGPCIYGDTGTDCGWSVSPVGGFLPCASPGYVIAGFSNSFSVAGANELYLLKTDANLSTGCHDTNLLPTTSTPTMSIICKKINTGTIFSECEPQFVRSCQSWQNNLCYGADGTIPGFCPVLSCPPPCVPPKLAPESGREIASESSLAGYPNPVKAGEALSLRYLVEREGDVTVTLSDITGRVVRTERARYPAGAQLAPVGTDGLAAGTYIVGVTAGTRTVSCRVHVVTR